MPLYLVRWRSTLTVSLIRADSEEHLMQVIDEVDTADFARCERPFRDDVSTQIGT
jgi:hypothetical protein